MSPRGIVAAAIDKGLDIIAVTDHNTAENVAATVRAAERRGGVRVLGGMEVCTAEEVHVLALFDGPRGALSLQELVYAHMPPRTNRPEVFGEQVIANEDDEVEGFVDRLLIGSCDLGLNAVVEAIHERGGLAVAAHVDRESFSLLGQLGFIPPDLEVDAFELSKWADVAALVAEHPELASRPLIRGSDAHFIEDVGSVWTEFEIESADVAEIGLALRGIGGRKAGEKG